MDRYKDLHFSEVPTLQPVQTRIESQKSPKTQPRDQCFAKVQIQNEDGKTITSHRMSDITGELQSLCFLPLIPGACFYVYNYLGSIFFYFLIQIPGSKIPVINSVLNSVSWSCDYWQNKILKSQDKKLELKWEFSLFTVHSLSGGSLLILNHKLCLVVGFLLQ